MKDDTVDTERQLAQPVKHFRVVSVGQEPQLARSCRAWLPTANWLDFVINAHQRKRRAAELLRSDPRHDQPPDPDERRCQNGPQSQNGARKLLADLEHE